MLRILGTPTSIDFSLENLVAHRVLLLLDILPKAVSLGMSDADEPLKVILIIPVKAQLLTNT